MKKTLPKYSLHVSLGSPTLRRLVPLVQDTLLELECKRKFEKKKPLEKTLPSVPWRMWPR